MIPEEKGPLSVVVITKNEDKNIAACLKSARWADEIIVVNNESTDRTCELARREMKKVSGEKESSASENISDSD